MAQKLMALITDPVPGKWYWTMNDWPDYDVEVWVRRDPCLSKPCKAIFNQGIPEWYGFDLAYSCPPHVFCQWKKYP
jgi:hypothetical protein